MGQGINVDPARDFCGMYFGLAPNQDEISGIDYSPGYLRNAAKMLAGGKGLVCPACRRTGRSAMQSRTETV